MRHPFFDLPRPTILGHRGSAGDAPENTLLSFERALLAGAHVIESDVHLTRDGVPVLIHDSRVDRTCDGKGAVDELEWAELAQLDAAHDWSPDGGGSHPHRGQGVRVPSLEEAFDAFPEARFNLELKGQSRVLVERAVWLVGDRGRADRTLLTAGEDSIMAMLRETLAQSPVRPAVGASLADILDFVRSATEGKPPTSPAMALQIPAAFGGNPLVTRELVDHAARHDVAIHVWTINEPDQIRALLELGVDGIVTDFPGRMRELLERRGDS